MKRYEEYKDTGDIWLQSVPAHWKNKSIKSIMKLSDERCGNREYLELLSVYREYGVIKKSSRDDNYNKESEDTSKYKYVGKNYIVMNKMKMWQGSLGISKYEGIVSPAYIVCKPTHNLNNKFLNYLLRSNKLKHLYNIISYGVRVGQWDLRFDDIKNYNLYIPPPSEQDQIVYFLDYKLDKIDRLIAIKQRQIELLKEERQAIINKAVTKGINSDVKMKDSGIEWIGEMPEDWKITKVDDICEVNASIREMLNKFSDDDYICFLPMESISVDGYISCENKRKLAEVKKGYSSFAKNDVIIAKITPCFENGKGACLDCLDSEIGFGTTELINLRANKLCIPKFLYYITQSEYFRKKGSESMTGSAGQKRIPLTFVCEFEMPLPPIKIQESIVNYIESYKSSSKKLESNLSTQINLLIQYRTCLISDAVTGAIDVSNWKSNVSS